MARVEWPTVSHARELASAVSAWRPTLCGCFGFIDGVFFKAPRPQDGDGARQRGMYTAYKGGHGCKLLFVFGSDGTVLSAAVNYPGSCHDALLATDSRLYETLADKYPKETNLWIAGDTALTGTEPQLKRVLSSVELAGLAGDERAMMREVNTELSSVRVASEWGIGGIKQAFPGIARLESHPHMRLLVQQVIIRLWNLRTRRLGVNQLRNVFKAR